MEPLDPVAQCLCFGVIGLVMWWDDQVKSAAPKPASPVRKVVESKAMPTFEAPKVQASIPEVVPSVEKVRNGTTHEKHLKGVVV